MTDAPEIELPPECESIVRGLWDFLDAELDDASLARIQDHLDACGHCRSHADFERRLLEELGAMKRVRSDSDALRARIEAALRSVGETG